MTQEIAATAPKQFEFKAEVQQLLHILVHSLYTEKEIFLRELISNASDALNRIRFEMLTNSNVVDPEAELAIYVEVDEEANTLTISDTGIGMTQEELISNLGTIAKSGAADFLKKLQDSKDNARDIIGQFGVGFYSVFMVADEVQVTTRSYKPEAQAVRWTSDGSNTYTVEAADKTSRGTSILIKLKGDEKEFAAKYRLEGVVKKHSDFVTYPIYMGEKAINQQTALWRQSAAEIDAEKYHSFYKQLTLDFEDPTLHLHIASDAPVQVNSLLYIPARREGVGFSMRKEPGLKLYCRNVLIQESTTDLLPNHFRFVYGVVDSEDIPLSVSRESMQSTRIKEKLKQVITKRLVRELEDLGKNDVEKYAKFWKEFGVFIKEGIATDFSSRDTLLNLLRFPSSKAGKGNIVSLQAYVDAMPEWQGEIYYLLADSITAAENSPHMDYFKKRNVEVLYLVEAMDSFMLTSLREFGGKKLQNVDGADLPQTEEEKAEDEAAKEKLPDDKFAEIITRFKSVLDERVEDVRQTSHLSGSPVRLVSPTDAAGHEMDRIRRMLDQNYQAPKRILEINRGHPIIQNLPNVLRNNIGLADLVIEQLLDGALLSDGLHPNPVEMLPRMNRILELATKQ